MTKEQFIELKNALGEKGYRYTESSFTNESFAYYKPFVKYSNPYEEGRPCYQIFFRVWDYTEFPEASDRPYGVDVRVAVGRTIYEVINLDFMYDGQPISYFENKAESFYEWVVKNIEINEK